MDDIYKNIEKYNPNKKRKVLITFDDMTADTLSNKKLNTIVTELFIIRVRKYNISLVFLTQSYFDLPNNSRLQNTRYFIMKIPNKQELQQGALNHSLSDIDFSDLMNLC